jgi:hypothetical protein
MRLLLLQYSCWLIIRSTEGPIFDNLNFKYEEVEGWPWAESPFIHIQQKVHVSFWTAIINGES